MQRVREIAREKTWLYAGNLLWPAPRTTFFKKLCGIPRDNQQGSRVILKKVDGILSKQQQDVLIGLMLGDGNLEFDGYRGTRLQVKQSEARREYVEWLYSHFAFVTKTPPQQRKDTSQWYFGTRFTAEFERIR